MLVRDVWNESIEAGPRVTSFFSRKPRDASLQKFSHSAKNVALQFFQIRLYPFNMKIIQIKNFPWFPADANSQATKAIAMNR